MRYLLLFCALSLLNIHAADVRQPKLRVGEQVQSSIAFCMLIATIHDPSLPMMKQLDNWFRITDIEVDRTYPDAQEWVGKTFVDIAWGGALRYGAIGVFDKVLNRILDISQIKFAGNDLLTSAKMLIEARDLDLLYAVLPSEDAANMAKNAPRILEVVMRHPTYTKSVNVRDKSLPSTYAQDWRDL